MQYFIIAYVYCALRMYSVRRHTDWQDIGAVKCQRVHQTHGVLYTCIILYYMHRLRFRASWPSVTVRLEKDLYIFTNLNKNNYDLTCINNETSGLIYLIITTTVCF